MRRAATPIGAAWVLYALSLSSATGVPEQAVELSGGLSGTARDAPS